jgi:uncharacterized protein YkwD
VKRELLTEPQTQSGNTKVFTLPRSRHSESHQYYLSLLTPVILASSVFGTFDNSAFAIETPKKNSSQIKQTVYSLSRTQEASSYLKVWGVPASVALGSGKTSAQKRARGTYITALAGQGIGLDLCLQPGDVLISLNGTPVLSSRHADAFLSKFKTGKLRAVVARVSGNNVLMLNPATSISPSIISTSDSPFSQGATGSSQNKQGTSGGNGTTSAATISNNELASLESYMVQLINSDRAQNGGLPALAGSNQLSQLARQYANDMARRNFFAHDDPEGHSPQDRARAFGLTCGVWENLAYQKNYLDLREIVKSCQQEMMNEPPNQRNHRGCILHPGHKVVGVGIAVIPPNTVICVQEFSGTEVP